MQGRFIGNIKKTLKNIKQEIKGADVHELKILNKEIFIHSEHSTELKLSTLISDFFFKFQISVQSKNFYKDYKIYKLSVVKNLVNVKEKNFFDKVSISEFKFFKENTNKIHINKIEKYNLFETKILSRSLEEFKTRVLYELVEKIEKPKINGEKEKAFKGKVINGEKKILKIPKKFQGRSFLVKKDMLDVAVKVKAVKPDFDFTKYRFLIIFDNLPISHMEKFKYDNEAKELLFYFDNKVKEIPNKMSLVIWSKKGEDSLEKIFV